jgi:uncharacterized protein YsxB (DUF464 family)
LANTVLVAVFYNKNKTPTGFKINGHAGSDIKGFNVVCAAISILVRTVIRYIEGLNVTSFSKKLLDNEVLFIVNSEVVEVKIAMAVFLQGLTDLASEYPDFITIERQIDGNQKRWRK